MAELIVMQATVPADWDGKSQITVQTTSGPMNVAVPAGVGPGQQFQFQMPAVFAHGSKSQRGAGFPRLWEDCLTYQHV